MARAQTQQTEKKGTLLQVLGNPAYEELQLNLKENKKELNQKLEKTQAELSNVVTQRVRDNFERRLVEETSKLDKKMERLDHRITEETSKLDKKITEENSLLRKDFSDALSKMNDKMDSQFKWMIGFMISQTGFMITVFYYLTK